MPTAKKLYTFNETITGTGAKVAADEAGLYAIMADEANFFAFAVEGTTIYAVPAALQDGETDGLYVLGATFKPITEEDMASVQFLFMKVGDYFVADILSGADYEITEIGSGAAEWLNANATAATKVDVTSAKGVKLPFKGKILTDDITIVPKLTEQSATPSESAQTFSVPEGYAGFSGFTVNRIPSEYVVPEGDVTLTSNGTHNVAGKKNAVVDVPIPDGYLKPSGNVVVTENVENMDVSDKATITVKIDTETPLPAEIATEDEMNALLKTAPVGSVYKYVGPDGAYYENGVLYVVEAE